MNYDYELDIEPKYRYLIIANSLSKEKIHDGLTLEIILKRYQETDKGRANYPAIQQEAIEFINHRNHPNLLWIYIHRAYGNIPLPKTHEIIFDVMDTTRNWEVKSAVRYAFNYRNFFHTDLWRGHHSHCYVEIIGAIPPIFDELQDILIRDSKEHRGIGLCTRYDWQFIKPYLDEQNNNRQIK